jgi:hypothetical protein
MTRTKTSPAITGHRTVVVELFTSEGCSSCPPADALLGHLRQDFLAKNIQVIPLGFHVDYWNSLGWKDRFSSAEFTHRQEQYEQSLNVDGPYTPQMVVDGAAEFVGSSADHAQQAIEKEASQPEPIAVTLSPVTGGQLKVEAKANNSFAAANIFLAITEDDLTTNVGSGENGGRTLHHAAVVRELRQLGQLQAGSFAATVPIKLESGWKRKDLRAVVFVQESPGGKIQGAASVGFSD